MNVQASLWRSIAVFRVASLAYAALLIVVDRANYAHLGWAWAVLAGMAAWTAFTTAAYAVPARRTRPLLAADLVVTAAALASTAFLEYPSAVAKAAMPVTATWVAGPVLAWAVAGGVRAGVAAALLLGACDLTLLTREASASVSVVTPAGPVLLPGHQAREVAAAVHTALDNVRRHCGAAARAWVLVDDEGEAVTVTVRDDGPGIPPGRLALAAADGRLGVSQAICGRMRDLGGSADVTSVPETGTEVRLRLPRPPPDRGG